MYMRWLLQKNAKCSEDFGRSLASGWRWRNVWFFRCSTQYCPFYHERFGKYSQNIARQSETMGRQRFNKDVMIMENGAAFDLIRASVNLVLAGLLIALGTSLKLPLSTTYVTFMVAMGSSLADRAGAVTVPYTVSPVCFLLSVDGSSLPEPLSLSVLWLRSSCIMEAHSPCWPLLHLPSSYWFAATYTTARNRRIKAKTTYSPALLPVKTKKSVGDYSASM